MTTQYLLGNGSNGADPGVVCEVLAGQARPLWVRRDGGMISSAPNQCGADWLARLRPATPHDLKAKLEARNALAAKDREDGLRVDDVEIPDFCF